MLREHPVQHSVLLTRSGAGRGYASACVAAVTARELDAGRTCMLYTDLANPTSNAIYQQIGYRRVGSGRTLLFDPAR